MAIRRGLVEEIRAHSISELVLILVVIAFANAMRIHSMTGNTSLLIEAGMFGQPRLQAKWKKEFGFRSEDISALRVEDQVAKLRDTLSALAE